jgi:Zn-dependent M28 family amino/carboxypeptidase
VAVLLEVAEVLSLKPPTVDVELVFFDAEDMGRESHPEEYSRGAMAYARELRQNVFEHPVAGFLFDMVGDKDLDIHPEGLSASRASNLVALVWEGARATGARGFKEGVRYTLTDDHVPLIEAGLPTVDIIDFDYPAWHTQADRPDQVSPASLAQVSRVAAWLVYDSALARGPR